MLDYRADLNLRYWAYQELLFPNWREYFDQPNGHKGRPPVFLPKFAGQNVIFRPNASRHETDGLLAMVPPPERHKWFRSMNSSQALAQSVFGNLAVHGQLWCLAELKDDDGNSLLGRAQFSPANFALEFKVDYLGEPRSTSLDVYFSGDYRVAIECKYTESEVGTCSRPRLMPTDRQFCDGNYTKPMDRSERCSLTEFGVKYWNYVPHLFHWAHNADLKPCPLHRNYQLVRNVLAVGVKPDGTVSADNGHVVLVYDERNPAFQPGGPGLAAYTSTKLALLEPTMLRKCSWQGIIQHIRHQGVLSWLTDELNQKYGL